MINNCKHNISKESRFISSLAWIDNFCKLAFIIYDNIISEQLISGSLLIRAMNKFGNSSNSTEKFNQWIPYNHQIQIFWNRRPLCLNFWTDEQQVNSDYYTSLDFSKYINNNKVD